MVSDSGSLAWLHTTVCCGSFSLLEPQSSPGAASSTLWVKPGEASF